MDFWLKVKFLIFNVLTNFKQNLFYLSNFHILYFKLDAK